MGAGIKEIWTSGRLCDAEVSGCEADHYKPLNINGWFWASTLVKMLPTNRPIGLNPDGVRVIGVNEWAKTGDKGKPQPDGFTPEGGLVRVHYDQDDGDIFRRARNLAWRSSMASGTTPLVTTGEQLC